MLKKFFDGQLDINQRFFRFLKANHCRQSFINNVRNWEVRYQRINPPCRDANYLMAAFCWGDAPQSSDFWASLHRQWLQIKERLSSRTDVPTNSN